VWNPPWQERNRGLEKKTLVLTYYDIHIAIAIDRNNAEADVLG
jgi:hypothetical protein